MESEKNSPRRVASSGGLPVHLNGTATTTPADVDIAAGGVKKLSTGIMIQNRDTTGTNDLEVSLDGGADFFTIEYGTPLFLPVCAETITIQSSASTVDYEIIATY
jgi:hypothetical protein